VIVTLAGHVDHGKTSLVRQLTGVDTDRLAEEKRRGLTIDLGFAYSDIAGQRIGFVDVPGHHRFVHNMIAGVAANQYAMVVVAADDGPMPQTREHLTILDLLGVAQGIVVVTKIDRVDAGRVAEVKRESATLAHATGLQVRDVLAVSSASGIGVDAVRAHLADAARRQHAAAQTGCIRLAVDRAFVIKGVGLVVTGSLHSGKLVRGIELSVAPRGGTVRVRTLHVSDRPTDSATSGDRCAVNLTGDGTDAIARGDWLVAPECFAPTQNVVIDLYISAQLPRPVKHWLPIHAYHATSHAEGHVALLTSPALGTGDRGLVELVLQQPLHPKRGDRIVLRDHGQQRTLGGGSVIDISAPRRARRAATRLAHLQALTAVDAMQALEALLQIEDVDIETFQRCRNLTRAELDALLAAVKPVQVNRDGRVYALDASRWQATLELLRAQIAAYHKTAPHSIGLKTDQLRRLQLLPPQWLDAALAALLAAGYIKETAGHFHVPGHRPQLPGEDAALLERIETLLRDEPQPPSSGDMAKRLGIGMRNLDAFIKRMTGLGLLVRVGSNRVLLPDQIEQFAGIVQRLAGAHADGFSARAFRDAAQVGRNLAIDVLEHFDRCGYTRRYGEVRRIVGAAALLHRAPVVS
jgi:selenocysteine-specific elongation factor